MNVPIWAIAATALMCTPKPSPAPPPLSRRQVLLLNCAMGADAARRSLRLPLDPTDRAGLCLRALAPMYRQAVPFTIRDEAYGCRLGALAVFDQAGTKRDDIRATDVLRQCGELP